MKRIVIWDVQFVILHPVIGGENGAFRGTVAVVHLVVRWRVERREFLATHRKAAQRMVLDVGRELVAHLCGDERMGDTLLVEVVVQVGQIQTYVIADDMNASTAGEGRVEVHHAGIETIAGIRRHAVGGRQPIMALIPMAESHKVAVFKLAALGGSGGT